MTPEQKIKEREMFLAKCDSDDSRYDIWMCRASIAAEVEAENVRLRTALRDIRDGFDCDADAHRYNTTCRRCLAEAALAPNENELKRINIIGMTAEKVIDTGMAAKRINPDVLAKELGAATHAKEHADG